MKKDKNLLILMGSHTFKLQLKQDGKLKKCLRV